MMTVASAVGRELGSRASRGPARSGAGARGLRLRGDLELGLSRCRARRASVGGPHRTALVVGFTSTGAEKLRCAACTPARRSARGTAARGARGRYRRRRPGAVEAAAECAHGCSCVPARRSAFLAGPPLARIVVNQAARPPAPVPWSSRPRRAPKEFACEPRFIRGAVLVEPIEAEPTSAPPSSVRVHPFRFDPTIAVDVPLVRWPDQAGARAEFQPTSVPVRPRRRTRRTRPAGVGGARGLDPRPLRDA